MNGQGDQDLVRNYVECRSEAAFAELVRRHVDLVYAAALRMVVDPHLAEDVTQGVFVALAQNARRLTDRATLTGWLHRTTQNLAAKAVRTEVRRRAREQAAATMNELSSSETEAAWKQLAPHLDLALGELSEADRDVVLLRYFEQKSAREIGLALGLNEDVAQKRVERALERLRALFAARGVTVSSALFLTALATHSAQAAPAALVASLTGASLAAASQGGTTGLTAFLKALIMTKTKIAIVAAVVVAATVTPVAWHQWGPNAWKRPFDATYRLRDGEVLRHVATPFIPEREGYARKQFSDGRLPARPINFVLWQEGTQTPARAGYNYKSSLGSVLSHAFRMKRYEFEGPAELLELDVAGDWTLRWGATRESLLSALEPILAQATQRNIRFEKRIVERDVFVVSGQLKSGIAEPIQVFAENATGPKLNHQGDLQQFLEEVGDWLNIVPMNETQPAGSSASIHWECREDAHYSRMGIRRSELLDKVQRNLTAQTGLTFHREPRPVEVWFVTESP